MNLHFVAAKDYRDAVRSKMLWSVTGLLVALVGIVYVATWRWGTGMDADEVAPVLALLVQLIVPLLAVIAGYMAIVGERRSGTIRILLGLPPTRIDVVFGKLIGRVGVVATAILTAFAVALALSALLLGSVPVRDLAGLGAATLLLGSAFVGLAVGVSAAVATRGRAMAGVVGAYLLVLVFWNVIAGGIYRLVEGENPPRFAAEPIEPWVLLLSRLNPMEAYGVVVSALIDERVPLVTFPFPGSVPSVPNDRLADVVVGDVPVYLSEWFAAATLVAWIVVPVVIGYLRFRRVDLG